jgi:DNA-binding LytR/AlgR family response regulator
MKVLIVTNDTNQRNIYLRSIASVMGVSATYSERSAEDALFTILDQKISLVITEDDLPNRTGLTLARVVHDAQLPCTVIVIAGDDQRAAEAISAQVFDFIVKPMTSGRLARSVERALEELSISCLQSSSGNRPSTIRISNNKGFSLVEAKDIVYCEAEGAYTVVHLTDNTQLYSSLNLGKVEKMLVPFRFVRISRSALVNLQRIRRVQQSKLFCLIDSANGELKLPATKKYLTQFENTCKTFL